jgi:glycosyltransferase involved in cell wall biosynthesis
MQPKPKVVVVIPTYNSAATIEDTLNSIQQQGDGLHRIQRVILSDDGSTDNTVQLARACWKAATPLEVLEAPRNRGEYPNVNEAIASLDASVEWYCMMHSDNMAKPGWLEALTDQIGKAPGEVGSICTSWDDLMLDGRTIPGENAPPGEVRTIPGNREAVYDTLRRGCWWHNSTAAVRVKAFREIGGMPAGQGLRQKGDWDFLLRLLSAGWSIQYIPRTLMVYRENATSVSSANFLKHRDVTEAAAIVQRYCAGCPWRTLLSIHKQYLVFLMRRSGSSLARGMFRRLFGALAAMGVVSRGLFVSLRKSRQGA